MAGTFKNRNAAKDPQEIKDTFLKIICRTADRNKWAAAAAAARLKNPTPRGGIRSKLTAWAIETLTEAAEKSKAHK